MTHLDTLSVRFYDDFFWWLEERKLKTCTVYDPEDLCIVSEPEDVGLLVAVSKVLFNTMSDPRHDGAIVPFNLIIGF